MKNFVFALMVLSCAFFNSCSKKTPVAEASPVQNEISVKASSYDFFILQTDFLRKLTAFRRCL